MYFTAPKEVKLMLAVLCHDEYLPFCYELVIVNALTPIDHNKHKLRLKLEQSRFYRVVNNQN